MTTTATKTTTTTIDYETTIFNLKSDHLGPNRATLVHARTPKHEQYFYKAILYLHGYVDYYFHDHLCQQFLEHGYDFFALDLRKCGRSIISPEQDSYKHYFCDLSEYDEEITLSIEHMNNQAKAREKKFILFGHSTGGLIASLYASTGAKHADIDAVILNSPYLTALDTSLIESVLLRVLMRLRLSKDLDDNWYGRSIHSSSKGEWNFDRTKKPIDKVRIHGPSFSAVRLAQQQLMARGSCIECPVLFLCSNRSIKPDKVWRDEYENADLILNVTTMRRAASTIGRHVTFYEIENARHDVFLSKAIVRDKAFRLMFRWLKHLEDDWMLATQIS